MGKNIGLVPLQLNAAEILSLFGNRGKRLACGFRPEACIFIGEQRRIILELLHFGVIHAGNIQILDIFQITFIQAEDICLSGIPVHKNFIIGMGNHINHDTWLQMPCIPTGRVAQLIFR